MISFRFNDVVKALFLSIFLANGPLFALSETKVGQNSYEQLEHGFVLTTNSEVMALCEPGDTLVKGDCESKAEGIGTRAMWPDPRQAGDLPVFLESKEVRENGRVGWSCRAKIVRPDQQLKITSAATCKKSETTQNKTPRFRGV